MVAQQHWCIIEKLFEEICVLVEWDKQLTKVLLCTPVQAIAKSKCFWINLLDQIWAFSFFKCTMHCTLWKTKKEKENKNEKKRKKMMKNCKAIKLPYVSMSKTFK